MISTVAVLKNIKSPNKRNAKSFYLKKNVFTLFWFFSPENLLAEPEVPVRSIRLLGPPRETLHDKWLHPL